VTFLDPPVAVETLRTTLWKLAEIDRVLDRGGHGIYRPLQRTPQATKGDTER
jgi:hypothetical protein